ncbi:movement protein [viral metagenome]|uniref:Movement protein n=1 Tax=viral metagenome TaxID=1070528 RepID=A0A6L2ZKR6_9ZZZZ
MELCPNGMPSNKNIPLHTTPKHTSTSDSENKAVTAKRITRYEMANLRCFFTETERTRLFYPGRYVRRLEQTLKDRALGPMRCEPNTVLSKAKVTRGDYANVFTLIAQGDSRLYSITGPTGCGKSTFALLELLLGSTALIICPSPANLANQLVEFTQRMPDMARRLGLQILLPTVVSCDFDTFADPDAQLTLCTAAQFNSFVAKNHCYPPPDYLILDEYHLNSPEVIRARMTLRYCMPQRDSVLNKQKVVFVSATPPDEEPPPVRTDGLTVQRVNIPEPLSLPTPDIYRLSKHPPYSNQVMLVVADSCAAAHELTSRLNTLGEPAFSLCKCPTPEVVAQNLSRNVRKFTFVATPDTEAGITVPCSIMVNPGLAARVEFTQGVLCPDVFPLGPRQSNQRLGRAGRLGHTIVYTSEEQTGKSDTASLVELATGYLVVLALTGGHPKGHEPDLAAQRFKRLNSVNRRGALAAVTAPSPMLALYRADNSGKPYVEFGGRAQGFVENNAQDFKLFKWPAGSAYAPFLDLCSEHDLNEGNGPRLQKAIADSIVARNPHVMENVNLESAVAAAQGRPELYSRAIWGALQQLHGSPGTVTHDGPEPENWADHANCAYDYMLTPVGSKAWRVLEDLGGRFRAHATLLGESHSGSNKYELVRTFTFEHQKVVYNPKPLLGKDNLVDPAKLEAMFLPYLTPVMATTALLERPEHSVDLLSFAHVKDRSMNSWFKSVV